MSASSSPPPPPPYRLLRATDLLDLTFGFLGLSLVRPLLGPRRLVRKDPAQPAFLVVTFGPQHVAEQAFFEVSPGLPEAANPPSAARAGSEQHKPPPVASRIGGRSVLVFAVGADDAIDYTESGLLTAMRTLPLRVVDAAREPAAATGLAPVSGGARLDAFQALRLARAVAELTARHGPDEPLAAGLVAAPAAESQAAAGPRPENPLANPDDPRTGLELPYRLLLSPPQTAAWTHATALPDPGDRVELWHTRMRADRARAVWTRDPGFDPAVPRPLDRGGNEFTMALDRKDRSSVVHLTSNRELPGGFVPEPLAVDHLILSTLGGWLDSLGRWDRPPTGFDVTQWRHRAALGRDHYVRVMYRGRLFPFGHLADLVKVTERKFDHARPDRAAYLNQRFFIMVREPVRAYGTPEENADQRRLHRLFPFTSVRLLTLVTPDLLTPRPIPGLSSIDGDPNEKLAFFPVSSTDDPFAFQVAMVDLDGRRLEFRTPMAFVGKLVHENKADVRAVVTHYQGLVSGPVPQPPDLGDPAVRRTVADVRGQSLAYAPSRKPDDTTLATGQLIWGAETTDALLGLDPTDHPRFVPTVRWARAVVPALSRFGTGFGGDQQQSVFYPEPYVRDAFTEANKGQVFIELAQAVDLTFRDGGQNAGALAQPNFPVAGLSRLTGPVAATPAHLLAADGQAVDKWAKLAQGRFNPLDYFGALSGAKLFGMFPLSEIMSEIGLDNLKAPNFFTATVNAVTGFLSDLRGLRDLLTSVEEQFPDIADQVIRVTDAAAAFTQLLVDYIVGQLEGLPDPTTIEEVENAFNAFSEALAALRVGLPAAVDTGVRQLLSRIAEQVATWDSAVGQALALKKAIELAALGAKLPDLVTSRLEWQPDIKAWTPDKPTPTKAEDAVFWPVGKLTLVTDLRGSLRPDVTQAADVTCTLGKFDLRMVPGFDAIVLHFDQIKFTMRAGQKPDVEVKFGGVDFVGNLEFVQTLRNIIPLDGFSDPPAITVDSSGIHANYSMQLPNAAVGVFSLENLSLNAALSVPFIGDTPLQAGFAFCRREAPFRLTVSMLGGGGYFGIVLTPKEIAVMDAALEFGAAVSMNFGVASGSLSVMAGIYFRLDLAQKSVTLVGYLRARGEVDVLGIVSASIELYMELGYKDGYAIGRASLTISIEIGFFETSVTIRCEKKFAGSGTRTAFAAGADAPALTPPTFSDLMSPYDDPATGARIDPVLDYCTAFAEVA
ncbi:hypothetical protein [Streptomyces kanamyceticus]|uniref:Uncharacterized protein n=1 Tax=Streptomyces kanamyceticus TaxID=1967 RepID=A0A5J6GT60_STRKN|nr:hypothetical protein [Streptomyces kanamyceticus]QEU96196.1 hypothetical protein CP970_39420 [Streptomyces kanamyceticus]